jgi:streptomycin 6-kinase
MVQTPGSDVLRLAFYGSSSWVETQLRPTTRDRQRRAAERVAATHDALIVAEFYDESGSAPFAERPEARRLLDEVERPDRRFDGVVLATAARAGHLPRLAALTPVIEQCHLRVFVAELGGEIRAADIDEAIRKYALKQRVRRGHDLMAGRVGSAARRWAAPRGRR